ncbi:MAG: SIMPL domain-containing protein [Alphaproteobacteria bacterium]
MRTLMLSTALLAGSFVGALALQPNVVAEDGAQTAYMRTVTVMNLDAEARRVVSQDRVQVTLNISRDGKTAMEAQSKVNDKMREALALAKASSGVKASTGYYNAYKQYPPEPGPKPLSQEQREKQAYWTAQQTLVLDGADKDTVLKLSGAMQGMDFAMQGMNFYLSREASDKLKDELLAEALSTVKARAQKVAGLMNLPNVRFASISLGGGGPVYPHVMVKRGGPEMMMASADAAMPAPEGQEGESEVTLNVNVEVHLSR